MGAPHGGRRIRGPNACKIMWLTSGVQAHIGPPKANNAPQLKHMQRAHGSAALRSLRSYQTWTRTLAWCIAQQERWVIAYSGSDLVQELDQSELTYHGRPAAVQPRFSWSVAADVPVFQSLHAWGRARNLSYNSASSSECSRLAAKTALAQGPALQLWYELTQCALTLPWPCMACTMACPAMCSADQLTCTYLSELHTWAYLCL